MVERKQQSAVRALARTLPLVIVLALLAVLFLQQAPPAQAQSTDATLSALTVEASEDGDTTNFPKSVPIGAFAATTETYTATVDSRVGHVRLTPTVNDSGATVQVGKTGSLQTVASGSASQAVALNVGANPITVEVTAADGSTKKTYTVTITRQPPTVQFADRGFYTVNEVAAGNTGTEATVTVTITPPLAQASSVKVTTLAKSTATATDDYVVGGLNPSGALDLPAGATSASFTLRAVADHADDARLLENVFLQLEAVAGAPYTVAAHSDATPSRARITIYDNSRAPAQQSQTPTVVFDDNEYFVSEVATSQSPNSATVTVNISPALSQASSVMVSAVVGSAATHPTDYTVTGLTGVTTTGGRFSGTLALPANASSASFTITAVADATTDGRIENINLTLAAVASAPYAIGNPSNAIVSIFDNSVSPSGKTFDVPAAISGTEGGDAPALTVRLGEAAPAGGVSFTAAASYTSGGATAADVVSVPSSFTVAEGETAVNLTIPLVDDSIDEGDESFTVTVTATTTGWSRASGSPASTTVAIVDDDTAGVTVNPTSLNIQEGGSGTYTVVLDTQPTASVTVSPLSSDSGAATSTPATLTFTTGNWQTPQTFTVTGVQDSDFADETVITYHQIASGDAKYNALLGTLPQVTVRVADDDVSANPTPPGAPTGLALTPSAGNIDAVWSAPASNGGSTLTGYDVEYKVSTATAWSDAGHSGLATSATISGLPNGVQHDVRVRAKNAIGDSAWSSVAQATPSLPTVEFGRNRTVLTSTLSVLSFSNLRGCFATVNACTAQLTSNSFTHESVAYQLRVVSLGSGTLILTFDKAIPSDLVRFNVGSSQFAFEDAVKSNNDRTASWSNPGLTWAVGDTVSLSIEATPPTLVASEGDSVAVTVTISPPLEQASSVTVTVVRESTTGIVNQDYTISGLQSGETLVLPAGAGSASFHVHAVADYVTDGQAEMVAFELTAISGAPYSLGRATTEVSILDTTVSPTGPPGAPAGLSLEALLGTITADWDLTTSIIPAPQRQLDAPTGLTLLQDANGAGVVTWIPPSRSEGVTGWDAQIKQTDAPDLPAYACVPACRVDGDPAGRTRPADAPQFATRPPAGSTSARPSRSTAARRPGSATSWSPRGPPTTCASAPSRATRPAPGRTSSPGPTVRPRTASGSAASRATSCAGSRPACSGAATTTP